ncbi:MAG TPA: carboxypeptidase regulatory-like domain-containing protein [Ktedonobacteraceae bacterium]
MPFEPSEPVAEVAALRADSGQDPSDQAVSRLSAAARLIAAEEAGESRVKRSFRLRPLRDISADIQRASTPHPSQKAHTEFDTQPGSDAGQLVRSNHKDRLAWPAWFGEDDEAEKESDAWANFTDPLQARSLPTVNDAAPIEEADIRRVQMEEQTTQPLFTMVRAKRRFSRWHIAFASMVLLAVLALLVDGSLLSFAFNHTGRTAKAQAGPPTLLLSTNLVNPGASVTVQLSHFVPQTRVVLTHDVQETLTLSNNQSILEIDANGSASGNFSIDTTWGPGFHLIVAEDVATRDTASAMMQIAGEGPSRPPHLLVDNPSLDLGDAVQGADTIQPLELRNSGSGSISWSASSNVPWLLVAPAQGVFSAGQSISVAVQRSNLPPKSYTGTLTIFSTVGAPQTIHVSMKVSALPPDAGPMISLVPPLLAFTTTDGATVPETQIVTLSNPGQQALSWAVNIGATSRTTMQGKSATQATANPTPLAAWLSTDLHSGVLSPGGSVRIRVSVNSQSLLPGAYMAPLTFSSGTTLGAYDNPQVMNVALTVQPHCGLLTSTGVLDFTAVMGQTNPSNHTVGLSTTSSCGSDTLDWHALSSAGWLTVSPQNGQLKGISNGVTSIGANTTTLKAGRYTGLVTIQAGKSTQTVVVYLTLQPHPAPSEPILGASPLSVNFSIVQGQTSPASQVVTITNNGGSALKWHTSIIMLGTNWLSALPTGGTVLPDQTGQATISVDTTGLTPGTYTGQVMLSATDSRGAPASGSAQVITISLTVQPPCSLAQPSASSLLFTATAGGANPLMQTVNLTSSGSCAWPVHWTTTSSAAWLTLSAPTGALTTLSQQGSINVGANIAGLGAGTYKTQVKISAVDSAGTVANGSPQTFSVELTIQQPCTLSLLNQITLKGPPGQTSADSQAFTIGTADACGGDVSWTATGDANSSSWLNLSATSGTDVANNGSSVTVSASTSQLAPGNYTGQITVSASLNGVVLQGSPQTITVNLQVTGYTVSGTVQACAGPAPDCSSSQAFNSATVTLVNDSNNTIETVTTDSSGNFTLTNVPPGTYTINVSGSVNSVAYSGSVMVSVNGNTNSVSVSAFPS